MTLMTYCHQDFWQDYKLGDLILVFDQLLSFFHFPSHPTNTNNPYDDYKDVKQSEVINFGHTSLATNFA